MVSSKEEVKLSSKTAMVSQPAATTKGNVSFDNDSFYEAIKALYRKITTRPFSMLRKPEKAAPMTLFVYILRLRRSR